MALICPAIFCFDLFRVCLWSQQLQRRGKKERKKNIKVCYFVSLSQRQCECCTLRETKSSYWSKMKGHALLQGEIYENLWNLFDFLKKSSQKPSDQNSWNLFWSILKNVDSSLIKSWSLWSRMGHNDRGGPNL